MSSTAKTVPVAAERTAWAELRRAWPILAGSTLGYSAMGLNAYTASIFVVPLTHEFGWSLTLITSVSLPVGIGMAVGMPVAGWVVDRFGIPLPALIAGVAVSLAFFLLSRMDGAFASYVFAQLMLATLALGAGPVSFTRAVNQAFDRMRGLALGITLSGAGLVAVLAPPILTRIIEADGWRAAYRALAGFQIALLPFWFTLLVIGLRRVSAEAPPSLVRPENPIRDALRDPVYRRLMLAFPLMAFGIGGAAFHLVPYLSQEGVSLGRAGAFAGVMGLAMLVGRLLTGFLFDRFFAPRVAATVLALGALGCTLLAVLGVPGAWLSAFLIGLTLGAETDVVGYLTARYFGLAAYGRLYGILIGLTAGSLGAAPFLTSSLRAVFDYDFAFLTGAGLLMVGAAILLTLPPFRQS